MDLQRGPAVELCAGMGGIGIALRSLGFDVVRAYDFWKQAVDVYNHNHPGAVAQVCNLMNKEGYAQVAEAKRMIGDVELMAAGPPCKGFSQLLNGFHDGRNGHNRVLAAMPDYIALLQPRMFLIENVPDLVRHCEGRTFASLMERLERPGKRLQYRVGFKVFDAALFGTPQARRRILILGVQKGNGDEQLPDPGPDLSMLYAAIRHGGKVPPALQSYMNALDDPDNGTLTSARQALSDLPLLRAGEPDVERAYASPPATAFQHWIRRGAPEFLRDTKTPTVNDATIHRLEYIPPGGCARSIPVEKLNGLSRRYDSAYRRLHPEAPSTALSTRYDCVYHYAMKRSLSVREYARLQGIPDVITFPQDLACRRSAYEMIGNSVPPLLIERVLGQALYNAEEALRR